MNIKQFLYRTSALAFLVVGVGLESSPALADQWIAQDPEPATDVEETPAPDDTAEPSVDETTDEPAEDVNAVQQDIPLYERPSYIGECRSSGATLLTVYEDSSLTLPTGDLEPYTRVTLTGVLGDGVAQLEDPLGWVRAATLLLNCDAGSDPDRDPDPEVGACYQVIPTVGLIARETPAGTAQTYQGQIDGPEGSSRVYGTVPPQQQVIAPYTWQRVSYTSLSGEERLGWVAEARGTQPNLIACPGS